MEECASLLSMGADVNWVQRDEVGKGDTAIIAAVRNGHHQVVSLLLAHGANSSATTSFGDNLLHLAAQRGDERLCSLLASSKCSPHDKNDRGQTPADVAVGKGYDALGKRLLGSSASLSGGLRQGAGERRSSFDSRQSSDGDVSLPHLGRDRARSSGDVAQRNSREGHTSSAASHVGRGVFAGQAAGQADETSEDGSTSSRESIDEGYSYGSSSDQGEDDAQRVRRRRRNRITLSPSRIPSDSLADRSLPHALSISAWHASQQHESLPNPSSQSSSSKPYRKPQVDLLSVDPSRASGDVELISDFNTMPLESRCAHLSTSLNASIASLEKSRNQANAAKNLNAKLAEEIIEAREEATRMGEERDKLKARVNELTGNVDISTQTVSSLTALESTLKSTLSIVTKMKESKVRRIAMEVETKTMCVVCQERTKCVLLMPCRHLCLCEVCRGKGIEKCPLCRVDVEQMIDVYA